MRDRNISWVKCISLSEFKGVDPRQDLAVVSIHDDAQTLVDLTGWRGSWTGYFRDVEYDRAYIDAYGWPEARLSGLFLPEMASSLNRYLQSPVVLSATGLIVHCYAGRSRSVAIAMHFAQTMGVPLICKDTSGYNRAVLSLLRDPQAFGDPEVERSGKETLLSGFRGFSKRHLGKIVSKLRTNIHENFSA
jgi:hypothetical protein